MIARAMRWRFIIRFRKQRRNRAHRRKSACPVKEHLCGVSFSDAIFRAIQSHLGRHIALTRPGQTPATVPVCVAHVNEIGVNFTRGPAHTGQFRSAAGEQAFKAGTLVFFSGLTHVGIVADEKGFYHASRRNGVIYSPFSEYGFRELMASDACLWKACSQSL